MVKSIIELKIDRLAGLGDGAGTYKGRKVFVPYTVSGDVIRAQINRQTTDADYATLTEILTSSSNRTQPVCKHFGTCGGCSLQHLKDFVYTDFKQSMAQEAVRKAGFDIKAESIIRLPANSRRRVELKVNKGSVGFYSERSHNIVDIEECKIMEPELLELMLQMKKQLVKDPGITSIQINGVDGGYDIVLEATDSISWQPDNDKIKRISVSYGNKIKILYESAPVTLTLGDVKVEITPGAFLQASRTAQEHMIQLVQDAVKGATHVLDLFAGIGTYSFPISANSKVTAIEGDAAMVGVMQIAAQKYKRTLQTEQRDLFATPIAKAALSKYDAVIINPPRSGAKAQTEQLALSNVPKIVMVSCNPATFIRDARVLKGAGYQLRSLTPIDQFVYSSHLELVAVLTV